MLKVRLILVPIPDLGGGPCCRVDLGGLDTPVRLRLGTDAVLPPAEKEEQDPNVQAAGRRMLAGRALLPRQL